MTQPLLSFVVSAYNAEATLQRTLGSLATDVDRSLVEVLIVDDGSTDGTARIADAFCSVNPNFRLLSQANQGLGAVRNRGIASARGDFVTFCDADDIFLPVNHLQVVEQMRQASADIGLGLGFSLIDNRSIEDFWDTAILRTLKELGDGEATRHLKFLVQPSVCTGLPAQLRDGRRHSIQRRSPVRGRRVHDLRIDQVRSPLLFGAAAFHLRRRPVGFDHHRNLGASHGDIRQPRADHRGGESK